MTDEEFRQKSIENPGVLFPTGGETANYLPKGYLNGYAVELSFVFSPPMWRYIGERRGWVDSSEYTEVR